MSKLSVIFITALVFLSMTSISSGQGSCDAQWCGEQYSAGGIYTGASVGIGTSAPQAQLHINKRTGHEASDSADTVLLTSANDVTLRLKIQTTEDDPIKTYLNPSAPPSISVLQRQATGEGAIVVIPSSPSDPRFDPFYDPGSLVLRALSANMPIVLATAHEDRPGNLTPVERVRIAGNGDVGIGTCPVDIDPLRLGPCPDPKAKLHVTGNQVRLENGEKQLDFRVDGGAVDIESTNHSLFIASYGSGSCPNNCNNVYINPYPSTGNVGIGTTEPQARLDVNGTTRTKILEITGGGDVAETFEVLQADILEPGMVVVIDATQPGRLKVSSEAYDHKVAGIISGAGSLEPGLIIGKDPQKQNSDFPVALSGAVYCNVDATHGGVEPGDLLTTSPTSGYAMVVKDREKAQGAILGKAMESLPEGETGQILVLVTLQ